MEIFLMVVFLFVVFLLFAWFNTRGDVLTGFATVVSRRVEAGSGGGSWRSSRWNYLVTFQLADGDRIELYAFENQYKSLEKGMTGQLTWHKDSLSSFEPDMEVTL